MQLRMALYARWCSWSVRSLLFYLLCSCWPCVSVYLSAGMLLVVDYFSWRDPGGMKKRVEAGVRLSLGSLPGVAGGKQRRSGWEHANNRPTDWLTPNKHTVFFLTTIHACGMVWGHPYTWRCGATTAVCYGAVDGTMVHGMESIKSRAVGMEWEAASTKEKKKCDTNPTEKKEGLALTLSSILPESHEVPFVFFLHHKA